MSSSIERRIGQLKEEIARLEMELRAQSFPVKEEPFGSDRLLFGKDGAIVYQDHGGTTRYRAKLVPDENGDYQVVDGILDDIDALEVDCADVPGFLGDMRRAFEFQEQHDKEEGTA